MNKKLDASFYKSRAIISMNRNKLDSAARDFTRAANNDPNSEEIYFNWGRTKSKQSDFEESQLKYKKAYLIVPNYEVAIFNRGVVLEKLDKMDEAIEMYRKSLIVKPNCANSYYNLGIRLTIRGEYDEAITCYNKVLEMQPCDFTVYNNIGYLNFLQGKYEEAVEQMKKSLSRSRTYLIAYLSWAVCLVCGENEEEAERMAADGFQAIKSWGPNYKYNHLKGIEETYISERSRMKGLLSQGRGNLEEEEKNLLERNLKGVRFVLNLLQKEMREIEAVRMAKAVEVAGI